MLLDDPRIDHSLLARYRFDRPRFLDALSRIKSGALTEKSSLITQPIKPVNDVVDVQWDSPRGAEARALGEAALRAGQVAVVVVNGGMATRFGNVVKGVVEVYDGKSFTLFGKRVNYYATVAAPPTLAQLADTLDEEYGLGVPLSDLFRWGSPSWGPAGITAAIDLGPSVVQGTTCQQYAYRQADIDWQIWIQKGDYPLPRQLVITTTTDEARPQHTAVYTWNLAPSFNDAAFTFDPPAGAGKVVLAAVAAARAGQ